MTWTIGSLLINFYSSQDTPIDEDELDETAQGAKGMEEEGEDPAVLQGSRGAHLGGECELLYNQFELYSPVSKAHQLVLLEVGISSFY